MLTAFNVFAFVVVFLLYWIGTNIHAIAKRGEPARRHDPDDRPLTWRELMIIQKRPDHSGATDEEWLKWHEKYKDKIDTKSLMPERFDRPDQS